jgi:hypothetical protein
VRVGAGEFTNREAVHHARPRCTRLVVIARVRQEVSGLRDVLVRHDPKNLERPLGAAVFGRDTQRDREPIAYLPAVLGREPVADHDSHARPQHRREFGFRVRPFGANAKPGIDVREDRLHEIPLLLVVAAQERDLGEQLDAWHARDLLAMGVWQELTWQSRIDEHAVELLLRDDAREAGANALKQTEQEERNGDRQEGKKRAGGFTPKPRPDES